MPPDRLPRQIEGVRIIGIDAPGLGVPTHAEAKDVLARAILHEGRAPFSLPVQATTKGWPAICLPRARQLGLKLNASLLLSSEVVRRYAWETA